MHLFGRGSVKEVSMFDCTAAMRRGNFLIHITASEREKIIALIISIAKKVTLCRSEATKLTVVAVADKWLVPAETAVLAEKNVTGK